MAWKILEYNFRFCVGLGNNLITFMPPFCVLSEGREDSFWVIGLHLNQNNLSKSLYFFENNMFAVTKSVIKGWYS